jgi:hypothetical protein
MSSLLLKRLLIGLLSAIGAIIVCSALYIFVLSVSRIAPSQWENPPIYPNAQNVKIEDVNIRENFELTIKKIITFETSDTRDAVLDF